MPVSESQSEDQLCHHLRAPVVRQSRDVCSLLSTVEPLIVVNSLPFKAFAMILRLLVISLIVGISCAEDIKREENVLVLNKNNFEEAIANEFVLVEFCTYYRFLRHCSDDQRLRRSLTWRVIGRRALVQSCGQ